MKVTAGTADGKRRPRDTLSHSHSHKSQSINFQTQCDLFVANDVNHENSKQQNFAISTPLLHRYLKQFKQMLNVPTYLYNTHSDTAESALSF